MSIRAITWDLGGVLLRTEDRQPRTRLAEELNLSYDEIDRIVFGSPSARQASLGEITADQHWRNVCKMLSWPESRLQELQERFWGGDRLDLALIAFIQSLEPRYRMALLSNNWSDLHQALVDQWHIAGLFEVIVISAEIGLAKPEARIYQETQARLGLQPEQIIFVDDFPENVRTASELGWQAVPFKNSQQAIAEIQRLIDGDRTVKAI